MVYRKMGGHIRAQLSAETLVVISLLLLVCVVFVVAYTTRYTEVQYEKQRVVLQQLSDRIASVASVVALLGEGGSTTIYVPNTAGGVQFFAVASNHTVFVWTDDFVVSSATGAYVTAINLTADMHYIVRNSGGVVVFEEI